MGFQNNANDVGRMKEKVESVGRNWKMDGENNEGETKAVESVCLSYGTGLFKDRFGIEPKP